MGVSSKPRIASSVDFPQPEGPEIETYSPRRNSRWIPASACVSTSSVTKTFVTPSICNNGSFAFMLSNSPYWRRIRLCPSIADMSDNRT